MKFYDREIETKKNRIRVLEDDLKAITWSKESNKRKIDDLRKEIKKCEHEIQEIEEISRILNESSWETFKRAFKEGFPSLASIVAPFIQKKHLKAFYSPIEVIEQMSIKCSNRVSIYLKLEAEKVELRSAENRSAAIRDTLCTEQQELRTLITEQIHLENLARSNEQNNGKPYVKVSQ